MKIIAQTKKQTKKGKKRNKQPSFGYIYVSSFNLITFNYNLNFLTIGIVQTNRGEKMELKTGSVLYPANKIINTQYGEKQTIKVRLSDGTLETIWFNVGKKPHSELSKGDTVQILYENNNGKTTKRLIVNQDNETNGNNNDNGNNANNPIKFMTPNHIPKVGLTDDEKIAIKQYIDIQVDLYSHCVEKVKTKMEGGRMLTKDEDIRAIATTIFIATQRKFNL